MEGVFLNGAVVVKPKEEVDGGFTGVEACDNSTFVPKGAAGAVTLEESVGGARSDAKVAGDEFIPAGKRHGAMGGTRKSTDPVKKPI